MQVEGVGSTPFCAFSDLSFGRQYMGGLFCKDGIRLGSCPVAEPSGSAAFSVNS
jgi:hypothetical protein